MVVLVLTPVSTFWFKFAPKNDGFQLALRSRQIFSSGKNPNSICDPTSPPELKWVAGVAVGFLLQALRLMVRDSRCGINQVLPLSYVSSPICLYGPFVQPNVYQSIPFLLDVG